MYVSLNIGNKKQLSFQGILILIQWMMPAWKAKRYFAYKQ